METNKLMINDLVYRKPHEEFHKKVPQCIVRIDGVETEVVTIIPESEYLIDDEIEPIPLTAEILERNNFQRQEEERGFSEPYIVYVNEDYRYPIKIYIKGLMDNAHHLYVGYDDDEPRISLYINYAHELQHALRLVGLDNVADNLKC